MIWFRGRKMAWDHDRQAIEQERQRWVSERLAGEADVIMDLAVDPDRAWREWRDVYVVTGSVDALRMMLEYVR